LPNLKEILTKFATKLHCLKTSGSKVVLRSTTYRTTSTCWQEMTPFPYNFGLKAPTTTRKHARVMTIC